MANSIGTRIAENRKRKGLTQDELAEYMGVSSQAVSKWENDMSCPDITLLPKLADYFNMSVDELLRGATSVQAQVVAKEERKEFSKMLFKVRINSADGDVVNVTLPLSLLKVGLEVGMKMPQVSGNTALKDLDFEAILKAAENGVIGKIVEIDSADGDHVEVSIE
jgi:transcriptional regulator with XRE-family HTH domain